MPFKEKMLWVSRAVMDEALAFPALATLAVGEDVVLAAIAWRGGAEKCFGVFGLATFLHLGFEPDEESAGLAMGGGYGELVGYDETRTRTPNSGNTARPFAAESCRIRSCRRSLSALNIRITQSAASSPRRSPVTVFVWQAFTGSTVAGLSPTSAENPETRPEWHQARCSRYQLL